MYQRISPQAWTKLSCPVLSFPSLLFRTHFIFYHFSLDVRLCNRWPVAIVIFLYIANNVYHVSVDIVEQGFENFKSKDKNEPGWAKAEAE